MQETFIDAYKHLKQFEGRSAFKTWIIRIMMNNCYRKREKSSFKNEIAKDLNDNSTPMFSNTKNEADKIYQNRELGSIIENALCKIPFDYRMVFSLREINGLNVAETASLLCISESNVKVRLNRSKAMLRKEIEKTYSAKELFEFNLIYCDAIVKNVMQKINEL
jgi:RNA polymerase sigma-70 factor (ECF subfamily)